MQTSSSTASKRPLIRPTEIAVATHIGQRRQENQDAFGLVLEDGMASFWVADGMGGASGGAQASAMAVRIIENSLRRESNESIEDRIRYAIKEASEEIFNFGQQHPSLKGMGTTISGFVLYLDKIILFNVGDSRVYRVRGDSIAQLTADHTLIGELLSAGALTQEQAKASPVSHMLTRSVGPAADVEVDCYLLEQPPHRGDIYLVCSDGLYHSISSAEIGYVIGEYRLNEALEHLVALANMRGGTDNITGILVECGSAFSVNPNGDANPEPIRRGKIVQIDLAEAAAADSFSKVKEDVDISAETIWGAQKGRNADSSKLDATAGIHGIRLKRRLGQPFSPLQRALLGLAIVLMILALKWLRDREIANQINQSRIEESQRILDFSENGAGPRTSILEEQETEEQIAKRKELLTRLQVGESDISEEERNAIRIRRLREAVKHYDSQIQRLELPVDTGLLDFQHDVQSRKEAAKSRIESVERAVEKLDKSLIQWRRRLREVEELDTVNLASELATISQDLKQKKELFEQATYQYLKELENQSFDPKNEEIQHRIDALIVDRNARLKDLKASSIKFIQEKIVSEARERGLLLIEHDELREDEKIIGSDSEYVDIRLSGDDQRRAAFSEAIKNKRDRVSQELSELEKVKPAPTAATQASDSGEQGARVASPLSQADPVAPRPTT